MSRKRKYAKGRKSRGICNRTGFEVPYRYIIREPGTNLLIDKRMSDGIWNRVDHPQNYAPKDLTDAQILKNATGNESFVFADADLVYTRLYDEFGNPLLTEENNGEEIFNTFSKIAFNSLKKIE